ncbi:MAG TPA: GNAT family protein [Steroidobacteraceae bacterium]|jgi:RimJ/RimL family protein N-acetyltransferase
MRLEARVLEGSWVRLEPLGRQHLDGLRAAIQDGELWKLWVTTVPEPQELEDFLARAQERYAQGVEMPFATIDKRSGRVAGSTRFMKADPPNKRVEIGFTFLGASWQRTAINTEAKLLMLTHAFEEWGANRVELLTDMLNAKSRAAIERLGAKHEGVLRSHMVMRQGRIRDSAMYGLIASEWPQVKAQLTSRLQQGDSPHSSERA